jgi:anti-anti-sigma regulatory factor
MLPSMMIGQLVNVRNKCNETKMGFQVCDLNPTVSEALKIMNLDTLLNVFLTEADALAVAE